MRFLAPSIVSDNWPLLSPVFLFPSLLSSAFPLIAGYSANESTLFATSPVLRPITDIRKNLSATNVPHSYW